MSDLGRETRAYVSAYDRSKVHQARLYRFERRQLIANFNGALSPERLIQCVTWRTDAPEIGVISAVQISVDRRETMVIFASQLGGWANLRAEVTLDNGEIYNQVFRVNVREASFFFNDPPTQPGPFSLTTCVEPPPIVPPSPPFLSGELEGFDGVLTWTEATAGTLPIVEYDLYRSVGIGPFTLLATIDAIDPREYTDAALTPDIVYQYYVVALDSEERPSAPSNIVQLEPLQDFTSLIVAVSPDDSGVMTSPDGINWTLQTVSEGDWKGVCYSPELHLFAAVSDGGVTPVITSPDGVTWTDRSAPLLTRAVAWSAELGLFAAVGPSGRIMTSPDGINWTARTAPASVNYECVIWAPEFGLFLAGSSSGTKRITTSANGITWTFADTVPSVAVHALAFSGSRAVSVSRSSTALRSDDGLNWTSGSGLNADGDIAYGAGLFATVSFSGTHVHTSPNGVSWTPRTAAADQQWEGICFSNTLGLFIATAVSGVGNRVMTSPDGINWTLRSTPANFDWVTVCSGLVAV